IADDAGVPIMFPLNGGPGKGRRQTAAGQDMVDRDVISAAIENFKLRCLDIDGAHQQAHWTFSEAAEINILLQQSSGRREVVQARPVPWKLVQRQLPVRQEETRRAEQDVPP